MHSRRNKEKKRNSGKQEEQNNISLFKLLFNSIYKNGTLPRAIFYLITQTLTYKKCSDKYLYITTAKLM